MSISTDQHFPQISRQKYKYIDMCHLRVGGWGAQDCRRVFSLRFFFLYFFMAPIRRMIFINLQILSD